MNHRRLASRQGIGPEVGEQDGSCAILRAVHADGASQLPRPLRTQLILAAPEYTNCADLCSGQRLHYSGTSLGGAGYVGLAARRHINGNVCHGTGHAHRAVLGREGNKRRA